MRLCLTVAVLRLLCLGALNAFRWTAGPQIRHSLLRRVASDDSIEILRRIDDWGCVKSCGACCKLGPLDSRPDLREYLEEDEYQLYVSMIGTDEWCVHFDKTTRLCTNYENRPSFCTVDKAKFKKMYDVEDDDFTDFCRFCCTENIKDTFGELSVEMERFESAMELLVEGMEQFEGEDGAR